MTCRKPFVRIRKQSLWRFNPRYARSTTLSIPPVGRQRLSEFRAHGCGRTRPAVCSSNGNRLPFGPVASNGQRGESFLGQTIIVHESRLVQSRQRDPNTMVSVRIEFTSKETRYVDNLCFPIVLRLHPCMSRTATGA